MLSNFEPCLSRLQHMLVEQLYLSDVMSEMPPRTQHFTETDWRYHKVSHPEEQIDENSDTLE